MSVLPTQLLEDLYSDRCAIVVGRSFPGGLESGLDDPWGPIKRHLALVRKSCLPLACPHYRPEHECALAAGCVQRMEQVASTVDQGDETFRRDLIAQHSRSYRVDAAHRHLVGLSAAIVTTRQDEVMEETFHAECREFVRVVRAHDLPDLDPHKRVLIKLLGTASQPDSLVIFDQDLATFKRRASLLPDFVLSQLASNTLLLVGTLNRDDDPIVRHLFHMLKQELCHRGRPIYLVASPDTDPSRLLIWKQQRIEIVVAEPATFIQELAAHKPRRRFSSLRLKPLPLPAHPYKFLDYYCAADRDIFFGRDHEIARLTWKVQAKPLTLLYGSSGAGKTSLVRAGVVPRLEGQGLRVTYLRVSANPLEGIRKDLVAAGRVDADAESLSLPELVTLSAEKRPSQLWVLDQFEEVFTTLSSELGLELGRQLSQCLTLRDVDFRLLILVREDYLGLFDELWEKMDLEVVQARFRLSGLSASQTEMAITEPARFFCVTFQPELLQRMLNDLEGMGSGRVEPANLQILCTRLFDESRQLGTDHLDLEIYERLGTATRILQQYLEEVVASFDADRRSAVRTVLKGLVTPARTKLSLPVDELARDELVREADLGGDDLEELLGQLQSRRVVRYLPDLKAYELSHDVLADKIANWISDEELRVKRLREILRERHSDFEVFGTSLSREELDLLEQHCGLLRLTSTDLELLLHSALEQRHAVAFWLTQAAERSLWEQFLGRHLGELLNGEEPALSARLLLAAASAPEVADQIAEWIIDHLEQVDRHTRGRVLSLLANLESAIANERLGALAPPGYVLIPAGSFRMGSHVFSNEEPPHELWLPSFFIQRTHVTLRQFQDFLADGGHDRRELWTAAGWQWLQRSYQEPEWKKQPAFSGEDLPAVGLSWFECLAYCRWLEKLLETPGMFTVQIPSEAELEKAARGRDGRPYPWGEKGPDPTRCNIRSSGLGTLLPVGSFSPEGDSVYGVCDLAGNAWDRSRSLYVPYPYDPWDGREDLETEGARTVRGGSWGYDHFERCARRDVHPVDNQPNIGAFRTVLHLSSDLDLSPRGVSHTEREELMICLRNGVCFTMMSNRGDLVADLEKRILELELRFPDAAWRSFLAHLRRLIDQDWNIDHDLPLPLRTAVEQAVRNLQIRRGLDWASAAAPEDALLEMARRVHAVALNRLRFLDQKAMVEFEADIEAYLESLSDDAGESKSSKVFLTAFLRLVRGDADWADGSDLPEAVVSACQPLAEAIGAAA